MFDGVRWPTTVNVTPDSVFKPMNAMTGLKLRVGLVHLDQTLCALINIWHSRFIFHTSFNAADTNVNRRFYEDY